MQIIDTPKALLVEVPEGAYYFEVTNWVDGEADMDYLDRDDNFCEAKFPPGSYGQPMLASEMGEEEWKAVIEKYDELCIYCCWPDFTREEIFANRYVLDTAAESGQSLLRSHNLKPETTVVIPKL